MTTALAYVAPEMRALARRASSTTELAPNEWPLRVRFAEVDLVHVVHHSRFWVWFEEARFNFLRNVLGLDADEITALGVFLPLIDAQCEYTRAARWSDDLIAIVHLERPRTAKLTFHHELVHAADRSMRVARARTTHVFASSDLTLRPAIPAAYRARLDEAMNRDPWAFLPAKDGPRAR